MRILVVTTLSNAINDFLIPHIKQLIAMGNQVDIACRVVREPSPVLSELGVAIYQVPFQRTPFHKDNYTAAKEIKRLVLSGGYAMVHTHTPVASFFTRAACRNISDLTVLYTAHGFHFFKGAPLKNWILYYYMEKLASRWTDGLITMNREDYQSARKMKLRRSNSVFYIHGIGVDLTKFTLQTEEEKERVRRKLGYAGSDFILFFAAELNRNKHQDLLIQAVKLLKDKGMNVTLLLAGEGDSASDYREQVLRWGLEENVVFLGFRNDIPDLVKMADVAVSSSRREGLPVNIMEAMASGLPLVVTDCRGNRDLVMDGENGFVVDPDDAVGFSYAVEQLYQSEKSRQRFGKRSYEYIHDYALEGVLHEMKAVYERFMPKQRHRLSNENPVMDLKIAEYDSLEECACSILEFQGKQPVNPFFTYEWLSLWKRYFAPRDKEKILVFQERDEMIGFLPLVYRENRLMPTIVYRIFGTHKSNYLSIPVQENRKQEVYQEVFRYFKEQMGGAILQLEDINDTSQDYSILCAKLSELHFMRGYRFYQYPCPYVKMEGGWDAFFKRHFKKSKRRSKMRSFEHKLQRIGNVQFIRICNARDYETHKGLLEQTFAIHELRFRNEWNSSKYSDAAFSGFYRELFQEYARLGMLNLSLLCIDGVVVSFLFALKQDKTLIHYVPGYHIAFRCFSLGHVHLMKLFKRILDEKEIKCFDFSLGTQEYKERWADGYTNNYSFVFRFGHNPFVLITVLLMKLLTTLKLLGRKYGWNEKIGRVLVRVRKGRIVQSYNDKKGILVRCPAEGLQSTSVREYTFRELSVLPLGVQTFVIKQIYNGKQISFLCEKERITGIKLVDEQGESTYKISLKE